MGGSVMPVGFHWSPVFPPPFPMPPMWEFHMAGWLETYLGAAFTLGLLTRPISFLLAGEMAVAYFQFSFPLSFWPTANWGTSAILYCFLFLYFMLVGTGPWCVDALIARRRAGRVDCRERG